MVLASGLSFVMLFFGGGGVLVDLGYAHQQEQDRNARKCQRAFWNLFHDSVEVSLRDTLIAGSAGPAMLPSTKTGNRCTDPRA